ncbi:hypothetical protein N657DRAFT_669913 [Parathielavia appendiculata]|uniref:Uncharacterized protein n=1 Tax=Parathielavia appendiculata TaxID=2587402 RepID=A0AAN6Z4T3_9PEZI|nr:hypothetical protein N657DRAFT_669913 [Parathielavia appendiculata]
MAELRIDYNHSKYMSLLSIQVLGLQHRTFFYFLTAPASRAPTPEHKREKGRKINETHYDLLPLSTHDLPYPTGAGPSRQEQSPPRVPSIADFEDFEHRRTLDLRRLPSRTKKRPKHDGHDRAAELAESYRVILPDPETMFADDDDDADDADDEVTGDDDDIVPQGGECTHCGGESLPSPQQTTPARRTSSPGSLPNMKSPSNSTSPIWATSVTSSTTTTAAAELNRQPDPQSHPYPSQDSSAGIHICTQLLADELTAALSLQWRAVGDISIDIDTYSEKEDAVTHMMQPQRSTQKVQVLLMIEAYEGVLRRCKQELQDLSEAMGRAEAGGSNDAAARKRAVRRRQVGEAVPVLEHWLETLRALYVGVFMDDAPDGGLRL